MATRAFRQGRKITPIGVTWQAADDRGHFREGIVIFRQVDAPPLQQFQERFGRLGSAPFCTSRCSSCRMDNSEAGTSKLSAPML